VSERPPESVARLEELLKRLEEASARLKGTGDDPEQAVEVLRELAEVAKEVQAEIERARREEGAS
jgi:hypothetical protein